MDDNKDKIAIEYIDVQKIIPNSYNPNKMSDKEFQRLKSELSGTGFVDPIQVVERGDHFVIIGGYHRYLAARELEMKEIPCVVLRGERWEDEDIAKFMTVRLNVIHGKMDAERFVALYNSMVDKYGEGAMSELMGFADKNAMNRIVKSAKEAMGDALPKEAMDEFDKKSKEAHTMDDLANIISDLYNKYGSDLKYSFMVFAFADKDHLYVQADKGLYKEVKEILTFCREHKVNINAVMHELFKGKTKAMKKVEESGEGKVEEGTGEVQATQTGTDGYL